MGISWETLQEAQRSLTLVMASARRPHAYPTTSTEERDSYPRLSPDLLCVIAEDDLEPLILLPPECWDRRHAPLHLVYVMLEIDIRT